MNRQSITTSGYFRGTYGSTYIEPARTNDLEKLTYYTPRIEGFQLGLSYSPDTAQDNNTQLNRDAVNSDLVMLGELRRSFGSVGVGLSGGYGTVSDAPDVADSNEPTAFNLGATASFGGFGLGVSYAQADESDADDGEAINVGVSYLRAWACRVLPRRA